MRKLSIALVLTLAAVPAAARPHVPRGEHLARGEQELLQAEAYWMDAEARQDGEALRQVVDPAFVITLGGAAPVGREAFIRSVVANPNPSRQTLSERTLVVHGNTGVIVETDTLTRPQDPAYPPQRWRVTATYVREHDRWHALAEHLVKID
jgi:hypothetical protein